MEWYLKAFANYFKIKGRSSRTEYWMFFLVNFIVALILSVLIVTLMRSANIDITNVARAYHIFALVPGLTVAIRRLHDSGRSGWWILLPLFNFFLLIAPGQIGENRFGNPPATTRQI